MSLEANKEIHIERMFSVSKEKVFEAWTNKDHLATWFSPNPDVSVEADVDLRNGGHYSLSFGFATVRGTYKDISPYDTLVFSWQWDHEKHIPEMLISLAFQSVESGTKMTLVHSQLLDEEEIAGHMEGWEANLSNLEAFLAKST